MFDLVGFSIGSSAGFWLQMRWRSVRIRVPEEKYFINGLKDICFGVGMKFKVLFLN